MSAKEDFQVTEEELEKFRNAMKKQEFRDLLTEYVKETQDPENKKKYEAEIIEMERRRGQEVKFLNPTPGCVIRMYLEPGHRKVFVNICLSDAIAEATCAPSKVAGTKKKNGTEWQLPYSLTVGREDLDKSGKRCLVYDCVYHPKTYQRAQKYSRFKQILVDTALEAVETQEGAKIAPGKVKFLSMPYKGVVQPAIVRETGGKKSKKKKSSRKTSGTEELPFGVVNPPLPPHSTRQKNSGKKNVSSPASPTSPPSPPSPVEPAYTVKYRGEVAMGDYTNNRVSSVVKRPSDIIITVELPGVQSVADVAVDVLEKQLLLENKEPPYHLDLALSYPVDQNNGKAKFDKSKKCLIVTLPVLPASPPPPPPSPMSELTNQNTESESRDIGHRLEEESTNQIVESDTEEQTVADENDEKSKSPTTTSSDDLTNHNTAAGESHMTWISQGDWTAPSFTYRQDNERVVIVLNSTDIKSSTVVHHYDQHQFQVTYSCVDDDSKQPLSHSLLVRFHADDLIEKTSIDVSKDNMVVVVTKAESCQRMWVWFEAGPNQQSTQRKLFMTERTVEDGMTRPSDDPWMNSEIRISSSSHGEVDIEIVTSSSQQTLSGDTVTRNQDNPAEGNGGTVEQNQVIPETAVWNGDTVAWNEDRAVVQNEDLNVSSQTGLERGHDQIASLQLTNQLLFELD